MQDSSLFIFILLVSTAYLLTVLKRGRLEFAMFTIGATTMFFVVFFFLEDAAVPFLARVVTATTGLFGEATGMFVAYPDFNILFIDHLGETISLYVDYECAGFIEIAIYVSLVSFFPVYKARERLKLCVCGVALLFASNVARLLSICAIVYKFGNSSFYFAHAIFGRFLFYAMSMCLYFHIFTKPQIANQKIGRFSYDSDSTK